jgi:16S rRNA (cytosine967-C5)-methyltransferase
MKMASPAEERILTGLFLCADKPDEMLQQLKPDWNKMGGLSINEKLSSLHIGNLFDRIFPFTDELSSGIEREAFILSHLSQPDLFLRLRPGREEAVKLKLKNASINGKVISDTCLALPNSSKIDAVIELNKEAVVQDYSSQRAGDFFPSSLSNSTSKLSVWDCCAASGGKSIMLNDLYPDIQLTVSDIRESIIINLKKRFNEAGITNYKSFIGDLVTADFMPCTYDFELIIADVPCSGSGTWGRTPEQLYFFEEKKIGEYASLQKKILTKVIPHLVPGGHLLYITCSVFKKENEEAVDFIQQNFSLQLIKKEVLKGYDKKADTMFAALLQKPL